MTAQVWVLAEGVHAYRAALRVRSTMQVWKRGRGWGCVQWGFGWGRVCRDGDVDLEQWRPHT
eukprot:scaffold110619_cov17-Tisochrysis_lutea.AAC.1